MDPEVAGSSPVDRPSLAFSNMSTLEAIFLGIIQGLTEFLPVSSSGHLQLFQHFLGMENLNNFILFDLVCHLGTLVAILIVLYPQLKNLTWDRFRQLTLATLPLFPLVLLLKPIKSLFDAPQYLGYFFLITSFILFLGIRFGSSKSVEQISKYRWRDAVLVGCFQAVAVLPGVSRSGSTISAARLLGWNQQEAVSFSFLLAIPAILGGTCLEIMHLMRHPIPPLPFLQYVVGFVTSFGMGYLALLWIKRLAVQNKFSYFVWYCFLLGIATILYFYS